MGFFSSKCDVDTHVVVIGGGYCGTTVARNLDCKVRVTLIDAREFQLHKMATLRCAVDDKWHAASMIPRDTLLKNGKVISKKVVSIDENKKMVVLENGENISYDYLVCATGATNKSPGESDFRTKAQVVEYYSQTNKAIQKAKRITVVGGGIVGLELCGEIRNKYPEKEITIIHSGDKFFHGSKTNYGSGFSDKFKNQLDKIGVKYILGERAQLSGDDFKAKYIEKTQTIKTNKGTEIDTDLVIPCIGTKPNSEVYPDEWLNEKRLVKVRPTLQIISSDNIFCCGDVNDVDEDKMFIHGVNQSGLVAKNIIQMTKTTKGKLKKYSTGPEFIVVPLGRTHGVFAIAGVITIKGNFPGWLKGRSYFSSKLFGESNAKVPSGLK